MNKDLVGKYLHELTVEEFRIIFAKPFFSNYSRVNEAFKLNMKPALSLSEVYKQVFDKVKELLGKYVETGVPDISDSFADRHKVSACVVLAVVSLKLLTDTDNANSSVSTKVYTIIAILCGLHVLNEHFEEWVLQISEGKFDNSKSKCVKYIKNWVEIAKKQGKVFIYNSKDIPRINRLPVLTDEFNSNYGENYIVYLVSYINEVLVNELNGDEPWRAIVKLSDIMYHIEVHNLSSCNNGLRLGTHTMWM